MQIADLLLIVLFDMMNLVTHVTDYHAQDKKLRHPDIRTVIHQHFQTALVIHLAETVASRRQKR